MRAKSVEQVYKTTAERLNLPEKYIKDLIEYFYDQNKKEMFQLSGSIVNIYGLGRFILKPFEFSARHKVLKALSNKFKSRRDDRGIVIRKEIENRLASFDNRTDDIVILDNYFKNKNNKRYGAIKNLAK